MLKGICNPFNITIEKQRKVYEIVYFIDFSLFFSVLNAISVKGFDEVVGFVQI